MIQGNSSSFHNISLHFVRTNIRFAIFCTVCVPTYIILVKLYQPQNNLLRNTDPNKTVGGGRYSLLLYLYMTVKKNYSFNITNVAQLSGFQFNNLTEGQVFGSLEYCYTKILFLIGAVSVGCSTFAENCLNVVVERKKGKNMPNLSDFENNTCIKIKV